MMLARRGARGSLRLAASRCWSCQLPPARAVASQGRPDGHKEKEPKAGEEGDQKTDEGGDQTSSPLLYGATG
eukprot:CAMPEP_0115101172 /NCGR_PEP_ID=MMETSP0227-20121206/33049_1 /TAXON_ID=89957 /ORGANISM="Polarella glacialis, Strain CCMP 1383" /LENGTH=71 /DNA_ID=CAMNT_0002496823 /DNA_START=59 /DNA_END=270 /DNA_ORIENTATION=-